MGVNNQFLAGTACLGIVALVVAIDTKRGPEPPKDIPGAADVALHLADVQKQRERWDRVRKGQSLSVEQCDMILRDVRAVKKSGDRMYRARSAFYAVDPTKQTFDQNTSNLIDDIQQRRAKIVSNAETAPEVEKVPVNLGAVDETVVNPSPIAPAFAQDAGGEDAPIHDSHRTTPEELDDMVDHFAHQETSVAVGDTVESAFITQPDPLNASDKKPEGTSTQANLDDVDGFGQSAPQQVPQRVQAEIPVHGEWDPSGVSTTATKAILEGDPNFDTVADPGPYPNIPSSFEGIPEGTTSHAKVLERAKARAATTDAPNFNAAGDVDFGNAYPTATTLENLRLALINSSDSGEAADLQAQIDEIERVAGTVHTPKYTAFVKKLNGYMTRVNFYERLLIRSPVEDRTAHRVGKVNEYVGLIDKMSPGGAPLMGEIWRTTASEAHKSLARIAKRFPKKKRVRVEEAGVHPKRQKTGREAAQAATGRQSETGEPPRQKPSRRSSRLQGVPPETGAQFFSKDLSN